MYDDLEYGLKKLYINCLFNISIIFIYYFCCNKWGGKDLSNIFEGANGNELMLVIEV